jgi:hypothetical protein
MPALLIPVGAFVVGGVTGATVSSGLGDALKGAALLGVVYIVYKKMS